MRVVADAHECLRLWEGPVGSPITPSPVAATIRGDHMRQQLSQPGGQGVGGSNPLAPTITPLSASAWGDCSYRGVGSEVRRIHNSYSLGDWESGVERWSGAPCVSPWFLDPLRATQGSEGLHVPSSACCRGNRR